MEVLQKPIRKNYDLIITRHARERWVERVVDPRRYVHLSECTHQNTCETCISLIHNIRTAVDLASRQMSGAIVTRFREARDNDQRITDVSFIEAITKYYREGDGKVDYYWSGDAILVVAKRPEEETPILVTVFNSDMLENTIFRNLNGEELKTVFKRWKFEIRQKGKM